MKKIKDGTYRAMRMDASGYVYGFYRQTGNYPNAADGHYIKEKEQDNWIVPIKKHTLVYRMDGKWIEIAV
jgi:hypothetical protein